MNLKDWKEKNAEARTYAHFDDKVSLENVWEYISNPQAIMHHGFYPFIHYKKQFKKYVKENPEDGIKTRDLCYSAHIDRYIYSYYGYLINQKYNEYMGARAIDNVAVAYRDNLKMSNIHFAKKAFDFIKGTKGCHIIVGDFTDFFDSLDHKYLKSKLCEVLQVDTLPKDYYAVYKNITRYSTWELVDLLSLNDLKDTENDIRTLNKQRKVLEFQEFKENKKKYCEPHKEPYGIPQGSAISAVLSNVYMITADEVINNLVKRNNGLYMRYSDDFIIVVPNDSGVVFDDFLNEVLEIIKGIPRLKLQPKKTQIYEYNHENMKNCNRKYIKDVLEKKDEIDYLGFTFDGKEVTIRDKTITKYYYRMHRKLKFIKKCGGYTKYGHRVSCKKLYKEYSIKGAYPQREEGENKKEKMEGNFLTYVQRAQEIFGPDEPIDRKTRRHMTKIRRELDKVFK